MQLPNYVHPGFIYCINLKDDRFYWLLWHYFCLKLNFLREKKKNNIRIFESFPFTPNKLQVARVVLWLLKISWIFWKDFSAEGKINLLTLKSTVLNSVEYLNWVLNYNIISSLAHNNESSDQLVCMFMFLFVCVCVCYTYSVIIYTFLMCFVLFIYKIQLYVQMNFGGQRRARFSLMLVSCKWRQ